MTNKGILWARRGSEHFEKGHYLWAKKCFLKAYGEFKKENASDEMAYCRLEIGDCVCVLESAEKAIPYYLQMGELNHLWHMKSLARLKSCYSWLGNMEKLKEAEGKIQAEFDAIPKNFEECFAELEKSLSRENIELIKNTKRFELGGFHLGLGMWIRNNWGLWGNSRLSNYLRGLGYCSADSMSTVIIESFHNHLNESNNILNNTKKE
jgi:hypothetical protein